MSIEKTNPVAFTDYTECAIADIHLRAEILSKMKKTKLYKHHDPQDVMRNAFNTIFKLVIHESEDKDSIAIADQQKMMFDEALEKLNLKEN